jgi:hypothetical protein
MTAQPGILAIWNDVKPGREADFDAWFQGEHLVERTNVPGFRFGRRHEAISGSNRYFNFYLVDGPEVLTSKPYLERLDNPTPMTKMIMSEVFINMNRTICRRVARRGDFRGAYAVTVRLDETPDEAKLTPLMDELVKDTAIAAAELWTATDPSGQPVSMEEKLRGGDKKIKGCLIVDTLRQAPAEALGARMAKDFPKAEVGVFRVLCQRGNGMGI